MTILELYWNAKQRLTNAGYLWEIEWQNERHAPTFTEQDLLREGAWVILCAGFRESVVRKWFSYISLCFCEWESANVIFERRQDCEAAAMLAIGHRGKIEAIGEMAALVHQEGFRNLKRRIIRNPIAVLKSFQYIGDVTSCHLAKNLGFQFAKPDRHLSRIAAVNGWRDVNVMCSELARCTGDSIQVVDLVLWRSAVLEQANSEKIEAGSWE